MRQHRHLSRHSIIELLYESGFRVDELAKMDIQDIDFEAGFIRIPAENIQ